MLGEKGRLANLGFAPRFFARTSITLLLIIGLVFVIALLDKWVDLQGRAHANVERHVAELSQDLKEAAYKGDYDELRTILENSVDALCIGQLVFFSKSGHEVVANGYGREEIADAPEWFYKLLGTKEIAESQPVVVNGVRLGEVEASADSRTMTGRLWIETTNLVNLLVAVYGLGLLAMGLVIKQGTKWINSLMGAISYATQGCSHGHLKENGPPEYTGAIEGIEKMERAIAETRSQALEEKARLNNASALTKSWYWEQNEYLCFTYVSDGVSEIGVESKDLLGKTQFSLPVEISGEQWDSYVERTAVHQPFLLEPAKKDGQWYSIRGEPIFDCGRFAGYRGIGTNITALRGGYQDQNSVELSDALTQLASPVELRSNLRSAISQSKSTGKFFALCCIDLDNFKAINDDYGHIAGDALLIEVAQRLKENVRGRDWVSRVGGDEFLMILSDLESEKSAQNTINRILQDIIKPYSIPEYGKFTITASIGVTLFPRDDSEEDGLVRHASQALFIAKEEGKNRYHILDQASLRESGERADLLGRFALAIDQDELVLHYQPKIDLWTGEVIGLEALLRWQHPERGLIIPGEFIPVIDDSQLSIRAGYWVIKKAIQQLDIWIDEGFSTTVSVNVTGKLLLHHGFVQNLQDMFLDYPSVKPEMLQIEILESVALKRVDQAHQVIAECHEMGITFALDDFGTGYSSLTYLKRLGVDAIKIDKAFVATMLSDPEDFAIVEGLVGLAESFSCSAIAEGVESLEHGVMLRRIGCRYAQGYGIGKPMPENMIHAWLKEWRLPEQWISVGRWHRADIALIEAQISHLQWLESVRRYITNSSDMQRPNDIDGCKLSRWFEKKASHRFTEAIERLNIHQSHREVHSLCNDIIALVENGEIEQANGEYQKLVAKGRNLIEALNAMVSEKKQDMAEVVH